MISCRQQHCLRVGKHLNLESCVKSRCMACKHARDIIAHLLAGDAAGPGILHSASRSNPTIFASYLLTCE